MKSLFATGVMIVMMIVSSLVQSAVDPVRIAMHGRPGANRAAYSEAYNSIDQAGGVKLGSELACNPNHLLQTEIVYVELSFTFSKLQTSFHRFQSKKTSLPINILLI